MRLATMIVAQHTKPTSSECAGLWGTIQLLVTSAQVQKQLDTLPYEMKDNEYVNKCLQNLTNYNIIQTMSLLHQVQLHN